MREKRVSLVRITSRCFLTMGNLDLDELLPQKGQDIEYDKIIAEIADLEEQLQDLLEELQKQVG